jgi:C_GCAxxG_C_C family probable redox protein
VLLAVCQKFGIENEIIPRIASFFGGGMGTGSVCGAVIGGMMAMGLMTKRGESLEDWLHIAEKAAEFRRFESEMTTINCRELTGVDLTTEEGREKLMNSDLSMTVCMPAVGLSYRLVLELLEENS